MKQHEAIENYIYSKTNIQLVQASLEELKIIKINPNINSELHNEISFGTKLSILKDNTAEAFLRAEIESKTSWDGPNVIETVIVYKGVFESKIDILPEELKKWVELQIVPQLVPYVRSMIASLSTQMMVEPIVLPTMDIIQSIVENSTEQKVNNNDE